MPTTTAQITTAGLAAAAAAAGLSLQVNITHVAIGSGQYTPTAGQTALANQREVAPVLAGAAQGNQITLTATFLAALYAGAQYAVGEIGFYIGGAPGAGGTLFAVVSSPTLASPLRGGGITTNYTPTFSIALSGVPSGSVNVTFDPGAGAALVALNAHAAAVDPHAGYLRKAGGTMTGAIELAANAAGPLQPVTLQQLTAALSAFGSIDAQTISVGTKLIKFGTSALVGLDTANAQVTFTTPFPTACDAVLLTPNTDNGVNVGGGNYSAGAHTKTVAGFRINNDSAASVFDWIAIGR